jgi:hypothetical protein
MSLIKAASVSVSSMLKKTPGRPVSVINNPSTVLVSRLSLAKVIACSHTSLASRWANCRKHEIAAFLSKRWLLDNVR